MRQIIIAVIWVLMFSGMAGCSEKGPNPQDNKIRDLSAAESSLNKSGQSFGLQLLGRINSNELSENVVISPLSISFAFGMAVNGAEGETRQAILNALKVSGDLSMTEINQSYETLMNYLTELDPDVAMEIANSIWYREDFDIKQEFLDINQGFFDAMVQGLNFNSPGAAQTINNWVKEKTHNKIQGIIEPPIPQDLIMFLINAVYFKGTWTYQFKEEQTLDAAFYLPDSSTVDSRLMTREGGYDYYETDTYQAVDMPYGDSAFSMTVILPRPGENINDFIADFSKADFDNMIDSLRHDSIKLYMPKYKVECKYTLNDYLKAMGMDIAFACERADFTNISEADLCISEVKHKTFIEVNEEGTEAAAVTSIGIRVTAMQPGPTVMRIDRPFFFVIRETNSNIMLFMGKIINPTA